MTKNIKIYAKLPLGRCSTALLGVAAFVAASPASAASTAATGIDASFVTMLNDLTGMLGGNFGALVLLISLIIGVAVYAITSRFTYVIASMIVAFLIGYGVDIIQGIGGVTASIEMVDIASLDILPAALEPSTVQ